MKIQKIAALALFALTLFLLVTGWRSNNNGMQENGDANPASAPRYVFPSDSMASIVTQYSTSSFGSPPSPEAQGNTTGTNAANPADPKIHAQIAYASPLLDGNDLYVLNKNARWPLASLTKIMTAVVALEHISMNDAVTIPPGAFVLSVGAADEVNIREGEQYRMKDMLAMALLPSSNKAADALAAAVGRDTFISEMNAQAALWGMNNTHYEEPTGLSALNQSTAEDLKILAKNVYRDYAQIFDLTKQPSYLVTELHSGQTFTVESIDLFAGQVGFLGGKTGYTDDASGNLLSLFLYKNNPIFFVVMGTPDRFQDTQILMRWLKNTAQGG
jgi:D-alanyl-D-alanine carboxypeptidase